MPRSRTLNVRGFSYSLNPIIFSITPSLTYPPLASPLLKINVSNCRSLDTLYYFVLLRPYTSVPSNVIRFSPSVPSLTQLDPVLVPFSYKHHAHCKRSLFYLSLSLFFLSFSQPSCIFFSHPSFSQLLLLLTHTYYTPTRKQTLSNFETFSVLARPCFGVHGPALAALSSQ